LKFTWLTAGITVAVAATLSSSASPKFETPIERA
jgi:hypothetical protein